MRRILICLTVLALAAGCAMPADPAPAPPTDEPVPTEQAADEHAPASPEVQATMLTFEGRGDTFLEYIDDLAASVGETATHSYLEVSDSSGRVWQGEEFQTQSEVVAALQPVGSGGGSAVELHAAAGGDWASALDGTGFTMTEEIQRPEPEIRFVRARESGDGVWSVDVTLAYPDTGWEDYADGWHVATPEGEILATRILLHPHENEQPFTRGQGNIQVPEGVGELVIRAHTLVRGYGADTVTVPIGAASTTEQYEVVKQ